MSRTGTGEWVRPTAAAAGAFSGARMVGSVNSGGSGDTQEFVTNTGLFDFGADAVSFLAHDTDGYTTGHGLADCRFVAPTTAYYRVKAAVGWQHYNPSERTGRFTTMLVFDGEWGVPSDPDHLYRERDQFRFPLRDNDTTVEFYIATLDLTGPLDAGAEVWLKGGFDAIPSQVGDSAWAGIISFEIQRVP